MRFALRVDDHLDLVLQHELDLQAQYDVVEANREHIATYLNWVHAYTSTDHTRDFVRRSRRWLANGEGVHTRIEYDRQIIGAIGLTIKSRANRRGEIGYWLSQAYTGQGIMTRCVGALLDYAFGVLALHSVYIRCATDNLKSCAIPRRLGFTHDGVLRHEVWFVDRWLDHNIFSILKSEWHIAAQPGEFEQRVDDQTRLRLLLPHHADALFHLIDTNRQHIGQWLAWVDDLHTVSDMRRRIDHLLHRYADRTRFSMGVWYDGILVGFVGYVDVDWADSRAEIGYWLAEAATGQGLVTRCVRHLTTYGFAVMGFNRLEIHCAAGNERSCAVPERLGYVREGLLRDVYAHRQDFHDYCIYAMLAKDWSSAP